MDESSNVDPTPEQIEQAAQYLLSKQAEAEKIKSYHKRVEQTNAAEFKDKPDEI